MNELKNFGCLSIVVMGVSGSGKSTLGKNLALRLRGRFVEGDEYHPDENLRKMKSGIALNDSDREPWLVRLNEELVSGYRKEETTVLACSALKESYRKILCADLPHVYFVHIHGTREELAARLAGRENHFMPPSLLDSQLATLEIPDGAINVHLHLAPEQAAEAAIRGILEKKIRSQAQTEQ